MPSDPTDTQAIAPSGPAGPGELVGAPGAERRRWAFRAAVLLAVVAAVRLAFIALAPLELSGDEAQYWDWSRRLQWGYFSKGPVIAACIWASRQLLGDTVLAVRAPAALMSALAGWTIFLLARRMFDARAGFWAAALSQAVPIFAAFGVGMTPDAPLLLCWSAALLFLHRAAEHHRRRDWLALAIVLGVGLQAKYTMGLFYPCALAYMLSSPDRRRGLLSVRPWAAVAISLAMLAPLLWWDSQHGWVNWNHNAGHMDGGKRGIELMGLAEFLGAQLAMVTPALAPMAVWAVVRQRRRAPMCLWFCLPVLGFFLLKSLRGHTYPNWTLPGYVTGLIAFAGTFMTPEPSPNVHVRRLTRAAWLTPAVATGLLMLAVLMGHFAYVLDDAGLPPELNPYRRLSGWARVGRAVDALPGREGAVIICATRQTTARLAFYIPSRPRTYQMQPDPNRIESQYDLWPGYHSMLGRDMICLVEARQHIEDANGVPKPPELFGIFADQFESVEGPVWPVARDARGEPIYHCAAYFCRNYRGP